MPVNLIGYQELYAPTCSANWAAKDGVELIDNLYLGEVLGAGMQISFNLP